MVNVLVVIPQTRDYERSIASVNALDEGQHDVTRLWLRDGDRPDRTPWQNLLAKERRARDVFLSGGYDLYLQIEDDVIVPPDLLLGLESVGADIAYALIVARHQHFWGPAVRLGPGDGGLQTFDSLPDVRRAVWGRVVPCMGCGLYATLIRRPVLEQLNFELRGSRASDWYLAQDAHAAGFTQMAHMGLLCGHIDGERVLWPDPNCYRVEAL